MNLRWLPGDGGEPPGRTELTDGGQTGWEKMNSHSLAQSLWEEVTRKPSGMSLSSDPAISLPGFNPRKESEVQTQV